jgi:hypothetical protein
MIFPSKCYLYMPYVNFRHILQQNNTVIHRIYVFLMPLVTSHQHFPYIFWPTVQLTNLEANKPQKSYPLYIRCEEWFLLSCTHSLHPSNVLTHVLKFIFENRANFKLETWTLNPGLLCKASKGNVQAWHQFHPIFLHCAFSILIQFFFVQ